MQVHSSHFIMRALHAQFEMAMACCAVEIVLSVPGFAQSTNGYRAMTAVERSTVGALRQYAPEARVTAEPPAIPSNLLVPPMYRSLVDSMFQQSPTFRRQCRRIANTSGLVVTLRAVPGQPSGRVRARTRIAWEDDQLHAAIEVLTLDGPAELIAHELEHVIEQLDGINLRSRVVRSGSGVQMADTEPAYETKRAVRVGLAVAEEMRGPGR
jgi:hypothetical protein